MPPEHLKLKKTEKRKPHKVYLSDFTKQLFLELKELSGCEFVLPSPTDETVTVNNKLFRRVIRRSRGNIKGIEQDFTIHDFRTTMSTQFADMGIAPHITELALGHKLPKIMATYNKHEYLPERAAALQQ